MSILGGIGLILFGVRFLRKGLDRLFGGQLVGWITRVTDQPLKAFAVGAGIGTVAPSSTGAALMTVQMLNAGTNTAALLAVLLGTNVGITMAVQLLAFRIQDYAGWMIFAGMIAFQFLRRERLRGIGQCVLALGFLFLALDFLGGGAREIAAKPEVMEIMHGFSAFPWLLLVATAVLGMVLQSSTASIGLGLALAAGGLLEGRLLGLWVLGTNFGTGFTFLATAWGSLDGRRIGFANLLLKALVAAPLFFSPSLLDAAIGLVPGSPERQTAMLHSGYNLVVALLGLPLLGLLWRVMRWMLPEQPAETFAPRASFLDEQSLATPSLALARATRECMRMAEHVRFMLEQFWVAFTTRDAVLAQRIRKEDDTVDAMNLALKDYLTRIDDGLAPEEIQWQFALHGIASELEAVGDLADKHLCDLLIKEVQEGVRLDPRDAGVLKEAFDRMFCRLDIGIGLLTTRDRADAREFLAEKETFNDWCRAMQKEHYSRLSAASRDSLASSASFLDLLNGIRRINSHISSFGYAIVQPESATGNDVTAAPGEGAAS